MYNPPNKQITPLHIGLLISLFALVFMFFIWVSFDEREELLITELMASNRAGLQDEDGDYPDWIEIHNPTGKAINLEGYWLADDPEQPFQWIFPEMLLEPGGYFYLFASGKDRADPVGPYLHTNFRISMEGDTLVLGSPGGEVLDKVTTGFVPSNVSYGRVPQSGLRTGYTGRDGKERWTFFLDPTPGETNTAKGYDHVMSMPRTDEPALYINEFITSNRTGITDEDGIEG